MSAAVGIGWCLQGGIAIKLFRRRFLRLVASAAALPVAPRIVRAQTYPARPVRWIVGFAAGTSPDIFARLIGHWLSKRLGAPFVIENRPGAGGNIGTEAVVRAAPNGYTVLLITSANVWNATLYDNFNFIRDIAPIAGIVRGLGVMEVAPSFPAKSVPEFIAYANANPGKINMGSSGVGTPQHLYGELFKMVTGVEMLHVPYRGSPQALTGLFAGETQVIFDTLSTSIEHIRAGRLRALAVTSARCESARGPDADRHVKLLIQFAVEGSLSGSDSHLMILSAEVAVLQRGNQCHGSRYSNLVACTEWVGY